MRPTARTQWCIFCAIILLPVVAHAQGITPTNLGPSDIAFSVNAISAAKPISPLIYGVNGSLRFDGVGSLRLGGNRWTGYNWETNHSNAGNDFRHFSDNLLVGFRNNTAPAEAITPTLQDAATRGAATIVTVPIAGFVSADANGEVFANQAAPSSRWNEVRARRTGVAPENLSLTPDLNDGVVYTDEFVNFLESQRQGGQEVLYTLDNEPSLWDNTHPRLFGETGVTFAGILERTIEHASAIKDVAPNAKVLGGVTFGYTAQESLANAPDFDQQVPRPRPRDGLHFNRFLLENIAAEEARQGRPLVDVLDLHWYPEARSSTNVRVTFEGANNNSPEVVEARVQSTRSLWDPTYTENSFISQFFSLGPIRLLDRIQDDIDELRPGTLISVSEYNYGGGSHISGAIAQADALGIFGREGIYNASRFQIESRPEDRAFAVAAFDAFVNFDGQGGRFGDLSIDAQTDDIASSAVYASRSTENDNELVIVAINRTGQALETAIEITDEQRYTSAEIYQITDAAAEPVFAGEFAIDLVNAFLYEQPAFSVSTIRLIAEDPILAGDYNGDGFVGAADYTAWRDNFGAAAGTLVNDVDGGLIGQAQYETWVANFGAPPSNSATTQSVPEPNAATLIAVLSLSLLQLRRRGRCSSQ